jgi:hypothetical protein
MHEYDNRYLWMNLKRIISQPLRQLQGGVGGQPAGRPGMIHPILTKTYALDDVAEAAYAIHTNAHTGKLGVLVNATEEGQGVQDPGQARPADRRPRRPGRPCSSEPAAVTLRDVRRDAARPGTGVSRWSAPRRG